MKGENGMIDDSEFNLAEPDSRGFFRHDKCHICKRFFRTAPEKNSNRIRMNSDNSLQPVCLKCVNKLLEKYKADIFEKMLADDSSD